MSQNKSLQHLVINTDYEIPSLLLVPFSENRTINHLSSNMQLPIWLLNHVSGNRHETGRKK